MRLQATKESSKLYCMDEMRRQYARKTSGLKVLVLGINHILAVIISFMDFMSCMVFEDNFISNKFIVFFKSVHQASQAEVFYGR